MSRSHKAAHYGALVEKKARERYGLDVDHNSTHDARDRDGRPWDIKGAMVRRASGKQGRVRFWKDQHRYLARHGGGYIVAAYQPAGRGVRIVGWRSIEASDIRVRFYGAGGHRGTDQAKIPVLSLIR